MLLLLSRLNNATGRHRRRRSRRRLHCPGIPSSSSSSLEGLTRNAQHRASSTTLCGRRLLGRQEKAITGRIPRRSVCRTANTLRKPRLSQALHNVRNRRVRSLWTPLGHGVPYSPISGLRHLHRQSRVVRSCGLRRILVMVQIKGNRVRQESTLSGQYSSLIIHTCSNTHKDATITVISPPSRHATTNTAASMQTKRI